MRLKTTTRLGLTVTKEDKINYYKAMRKQKVKPKQIQEKPIIFNTEMVAAILDGRKTQTRRIIKTDDKGRVCKGGTCVNLNEEYGLVWHPYSGSPMRLYPDPEEYCPYGYPGNQLWVRETFTPFVDMTGVHGIQYEDGTSMEAEEIRLVEWIHKRDQRRYPSIHMLREASRIQLEIQAVRVERVQSITESDAEAEGCESYRWNPGGSDVSDAGGVGYKAMVNCRDDFSYLWDSINADRGFPWESNPWVWTIEFSVKDVKTR